MGVPKGHAFFGNQYTSGGYIKGTFKYVAENSGEVIDINIKPVAEIIDKGTSQKVMKQELKKPSSAGSEIKGAAKIAIIATAITTITALVAAVAVHYLYKRHEKKTAVQTIGLNNTGICVRCGEPLSGSTYYSKGKTVDHRDFIECKKCGEKNFAWYPNRS